MPSEKDSEFPERRRAPRRKVCLPVEVGLDRGWTRDMSSLGVYFEIARAPAPGTPIRFVVLSSAPSQQPGHLECEGQVVRVERLTGITGLAVAIVRSQPVHGAPG